jgi:hypothetical protein
MRGRRGFAALIAAVVSIALVMLPAASANAAPPHVQEHYNDVFDILLPTPDELEENPEATFCGLLNVPLHGETHGYFSIKNQGNSDYPYFADRFHNSFTYTNPMTGLSFTVVSTGQGRDLHVVDNGDGTLTITSMITGVTKVYGPDGELLFTDRGLFRVTSLIDTNGTIDPEDDEFIRDIGEPFLGGPHETFDRDFCADFLSFTAP